MSFDGVEEVPQPQGDQRAGICGVGLFELCHRRIARPDLPGALFLQEAARSRAPLALLHRVELLRASASSLLRASARCSGVI